MSTAWGIFGMVVSSAVGAWFGYDIGYDRGWWKRGNR